MALFEYKAVSPSGETLRGEMEAVDEATVIAKLQEAGNLPLMAKEAGGGLSLRGLGMSKHRTSQAEIGMFTEQLSTLLNAGLPLDRALTVLIDLADSDRVAKLLTAIRDDVRGGATLSDALETRHGVFSKLYINMVRAGELGGSLDVSLTRLSEYMARSKELKDSVISALIYPILLLVLAITSLMILLTYVVPQFTPIFDELGAELPALTQVVLGAGEFLQGYWWLLILAVVGVVWWFKGQMADPKKRRKWDMRFLRWPMVGELVTKINIARLSRTVGTLLVNGVPVLGSLSIGRSVMSNTVLLDDVERASEAVKKGGALSNSLAADERFPRMALQMMNVGEETGKLDDMLLKVADTYDKEVRVTINRMLGLMVPLLTLGLASLIAVIVISILMAILSVNNLVA